jgi:hypothetical protein
MPAKRPPDPRRYAADATRIPKQAPPRRGSWLAGYRGWVLALCAVVLLGAAGVVAVELNTPLTKTSQVALGDVPSDAPLPSDSASPSASPSASASPSQAKPPANAPRPPLGATIDPHRANCAPRPSTCGLPDASNTGVPPGTRLTVVNGEFYATKPGQVVDSMEIHGCITIRAVNVTIRRTKVQCAGYYGIGSLRGEYTGGGATIEDSEIDCLNHNATGIGSYGFTARRLNIHNCENGFDIDNNVTVADTYVHDLFTGGAAHADDIQLAGGANITISHNTLLSQTPGGNSSIQSNPTLNSNVLVSNNLMAGGTYTLYCPNTSSSNYRVVGNRFSTLYSPKSGEYGPWLDCDKVAENTGTLWDNSLQPVR